MSKKKINYEEVIRARVSREEKEAFKQYCQANRIGISQALRDYMNQCVGGNR